MLRKEGIFSTFLQVREHSILIANLAFPLSDVTGHKKPRAGSDFCEQDNLHVTSSIIWQTNVGGGVEIQGLHGVPCSLSQSRPRNLLFLLSIKKTNYPLIVAQICVPRASWLKVSVHVF